MIANNNTRAKLDVATADTIGAHFAVSSKNISMSEPSTSQSQSPDSQRRLSEVTHTIIPNIYITQQSIKDFSILAEGKSIWKVRLWKATPQLPQIFVFKQQDEDLHENELKIYHERLQKVQETVVPLCYGEVLWDDGGQIHSGIALQFWGKPATRSMFKGMDDQGQKSLALKAYRALFRITQECDISWEDDIPGNVLVGDQGEVRLIDFSMSRKVRGVGDVVQNFISMNHILTFVFGLGQEEQQGDSTVLSFRQ